MSSVRRCHLELGCVSSTISWHLSAVSALPALLYFLPADHRFPSFRYHSRPPPKPRSPTLQLDQVPHVTIIRPVKGLEPGLYDCLASTCRQFYPREKLTVHLCVASADDPCYPTLERILHDFSEHDVRIFVEEDDPVLHGKEGSCDSLGPNPKIRNISRAYREAKGDVIWIVDCNVWVDRHVAGRMVDKLIGLTPFGDRVKPYKFVHQLPLVMDISTPSSPDAGMLSQAGGRLEEIFMANTHAKFYCAINTVGVAPCIVGKSNMFRKSHLDLVTDPARNPILAKADAIRGRGIDFFSSNICEDHLIGDLLWKSEIRGYRNHGLVLGDLAIQPMADMSLAAYVARRVRWLRVRKFTVTLATLVEPGVESLLCSLYLSYALTTLPWLSEISAIPRTWTAMATIWLASVTTWMLVDRWVFNKLRKCQSVDADELTPSFARGSDRSGGVPARSFGQFVLAWLGREVLALPIWTWAVLLGTTVSWRGKSFKVRRDMTVVEVPSTLAGRFGDSNGKVHGNGNRIDKLHRA
jgi:ceramide glucosyltransferase